MPDRLDPASDRAAYRQIADRLRSAMLSGEMPPGARLPSERELIDRYKASRGTVRQAIALLRSEGRLDVQHGRGAFVRERPPVRRLGQDRFAQRHRRAGRAAFLAEAAEVGRAASVEVLHIGSAPVPEEFAATLGLTPGAEALRRSRRYLLDEEPVELATSWVPLDISAGTLIEEADTGPGGIYARLEEVGHPLARFVEDVTARMPQPDEARALLLGPGIPVFRLVRSAHDGEGRVVEVCDTLMAADRYTLSYELPAR